MQARPKLAIRVAWDLVRIRFIHRGVRKAADESAVEGAAEGGIEGATEGAKGTPRP
jgi:hypothetical protein